MPSMQCNLSQAVKADRLAVTFPEIQNCDGGADRMSARHCFAAEEDRNPISRIAAFFELAADATGDNCLGLNFGQTRNLRHAGLLRYIGLASQNILELLENLRRFRRFISDVAEIDTTALEKRGLVCWWFDGLDTEKSGHFIEFGLTNFFRTIRDLTGQQLIPEQITFQHVRQRDVAAFEHYFGCPVRFGCERNSVQFKARDLQLPLPTADSRLLVLLHHYCQDVLSEHSIDARSLVSRVESSIAERLTAGKASLEGVAKDLCMSPRSLSRKLKALGTSFKDIFEGLRKELATTYLQESSVSCTEIAFLLGYNDVSSFNHAFKRWQGTTPTAFKSKSTTGT